MLHLKVISVGFAFLEHDIQVHEVGEGLDVGDADAEAVEGTPLLVTDSELQGQAQLALVRSMWRGRVGNCTAR